MEFVNMNIEIKDNKKLLYKITKTYVLRTEN